MANRPLLFPGLAGVLHKVWKWGVVLHRVGNLGTELDHAFAPNGTLAKHGSNTPSPSPRLPSTHTLKKTFFFQIIRQWNKRV